MTRFNASLFSVFLFVVLPAILVSPAVCRADHPGQVQLSATIDQILGVLKDPDLKAQPQERRESLRRIAADRFDYEKMTQLSLGRHWNEGSEAEKAEVTRLFSQLLEESYMGKIEAYTNEKVVYVGNRTAKRKAQINTKIITQTVEIPIDYRMYQKTENSWMVYDIVIEGVSLVANYRSQFGQILDGGSFQELIAKLQKK